MQKLISSFDANLKIAHEIYNSREKSPVNGLPELDKFVLKQFEVVSNDEFATLPKAEFTFTYNEKVFTSRGLCIAGSTATKIGIIREFRSKSISRISSTYIASSFYDLLNALEMYASHKNKFYIESNPNRVYNWLMCFSIYPEFSSYYEEYLLDPDNCVTIINKYTPVKEATTTLGAEIKFLESDRKITNMDLAVSVCLLLISMNKSFSLGKDLKIYIEEHVKTLNTALQITNSYPVFDQIFLTKFSTTMAAYPNLKKTLFYFAYENRSRYPELEIAITLMVRSTMTLVHEIVKFINTKEKCKIHEDRTISTETENFLAVFEEKKKKEGLMWPYYRFINPSNTSIILAQYPNLLVAAILCSQRKYMYRDYRFGSTNVTINLQYLETTNVFQINNEDQEKICTKLKRDLDAIMICVPEFSNSIDVIGDDQTINLLKSFFAKL